MTPSLPRLGMCLWVLSFAAALLAGTPPPQDHVLAAGESPLRAPTVSAFAPEANYTIEAWIYLTSVTDGWSYLVGKPVDSGNDPWHAFIIQLAPGNKIVMTASDGVPGHDVFTESARAVPVGQWTHVAVTMSAGQTKVYLNGTLEATGFSFGAPPVEITVPFSVGLGYFSDGRTYHNKFPGYVRQLRFWNTTRTASQIAAAMSESLPADRTGLVAAWPLDESGGGSARDISGNNYSLTTAGGSLSAVRTAVVDAAPFFQPRTTDVPDGSLKYVNPTGALVDFDSDGDLDLVLPQGYGPPVYPGVLTRVRAFRFHNGAYADATDAVLGNVSMYAPSRTLVADFNGDGRQDVFIAGSGADAPPFPGEQSRLLLQDASGHLVDVTATHLPRHNFFTHDAAAGDVDGDGFPDLFLSNLNGGELGGGTGLYLNDGTGRFTEVFGRLPGDIERRGRTFTSCLFWDVNDDGHPDLLLGGWGGSTGENEILLNDGHGFFTRASHPTLPPRLYGSAGTVLRIAAADLNGDGRGDLLLSTTLTYSQGSVQVLLRQADGSFVDATAAAGIDWNDTSTILPLEARDINGDGKIDLVATQVKALDQARMRILLNKGDATFVDASQACPGGPAPSALGVGDIDHDGRVDLAYPFYLGVVFLRGVGSLATSVFYDGPLITTQPGAQSVLAGAAFSLGVAAVGSPPPTYQWKLDGVDIQGATGSTYSVPRSAMTNDGLYTVVIKNSSGTISSLPARVTVHQSYSSWAAAHFNPTELADPGKTGPLASFSGDGLSNLLKYALGADPRQVSTVQPLGLQKQDGAWVCTYARPADRLDITYAVETSTDLSTWTSAGITHVRSSVVGGTETWQGRYPDGGSSRFFRLRVSL